MKETIHIIGAGIGGLTAALTLKRKGFPVQVYERAIAIKPVGAGIGMANNALQILEKLGVREKVEAAGQRVSVMKITDQTLDLLNVLELSRFEEKYGVCNVAIHRADLQRILAEEIGYENINLGKTLTKITSGENHQLSFDDGTTVESRITIAADGIKSVVREQLFPVSKIRDTGQKCWRGVCDLELPARYAGVATEAWGSGKRFGFVQISAQKVYWYTVTNQPVAASDLKLVFRDFHPDILMLLDATDSGQMILGNILDLEPIDRWYTDGICLLGDAAHASTPNLGQGACQAVEDAYVLGLLFEKGLSVQEVFREYQALRIKKAQHIVGTSWTVGKVAHWENRVAVGFRNFLVRNLPVEANYKRLDQLFDLSYVDQ